MAADESVSPDQFEDLIFPGVRAGAGWGVKPETYRGTVPRVEEGKTRLWRASDIKNPHGMWADKPLTAYGGNMMFMDVPHDVAAAHSGGEHGERNFFTFYDRKAGMPAPVSHVQFHSHKEYELSDWDEYKERWA
jgi:hypothetical protein